MSPEVGQIFATLAVILVALVLLVIGQVYEDEKSSRENEIEVEKWLNDGQG